MQKPNSGSMMPSVGEEAVAGAVGSGAMRLKQCNRFIVHGSWILLASEKRGVLVSSIGREI